jgi:hypothetical protein
MAARMDIASYSVGAVCAALCGYDILNSTWDSWLLLSEFLFPPIGIGALLVLGII